MVSCGGEACKASDLAMRPVPSRTGRAPAMYSAMATLSPLVFMASKPHRFTCTRHRHKHLRECYIAGVQLTTSACLAAAS